MWLITQFRSNYKSLDTLQLIHNTQNFQNSALTLGETMIACLLLSHHNSCDNPFSPSTTQKEEKPPRPRPDPDPGARSCTSREELTWERARAISITAWSWRHPRSTEHSRPHMDSMMEVVVVSLHSPSNNCLTFSCSVSL